MSDANGAAGLESVADTDGTGGIEPLDPDIDLTERHYASRRDDALVTLAEAEPVIGSVPTAVVDGLAGDAST